MKIPSKYTSGTLQARIKQAADALHYQPNLMARGLKGGGSRLLGMLVADIRNPFSVAIVHGVEVAAPSHARHEKHPTLDGSEVHTVLAMRNKVPGLKDMMDEPASASAAWLRAMAACTQEQGTALVVKISPSPMRLPLVALAQRVRLRGDWDIGAHVG